MNTAIAAVANEFLRKVSGFDEDIFNTEHRLYSADGTWSGRVYDGISLHLDLPNRSFMIQVGRYDLSFWKLTETDMILKDIQEVSNHTSIMTSVTDKNKVSVKWQGYGTVWMMDDTDIVSYESVKLGHTTIEIPRNWFTNAHPPGRNKETADNLTLAVIGRPLDNIRRENIMYTLKRDSNGSLDSELTIMLHCTPRFDAVCSSFEYVLKLHDPENVKRYLAEFTIGE